MKMTEWYRGDQLPIRVGVYKRRGFGKATFSYWNGSYWGGSTIDKNLANANSPSVFQHQAWRGVTEEKK